MISDALHWPQRSFRNARPDPGCDLGDPVGNALAVQVGFVELDLVGQANVRGIRAEIVDVCEQLGTMPLEEVATVGARRGGHPFREIGHERVHELAQEFVPGAEVVVDAADRSSGPGGNPRDRDSAKSSLTGFRLRGGEDPGARVA